VTEPAQQQPPPAAEQQVPVFNPTGKLVTLAPGDLDAALDPETGGYRMASPEEVAQYQAEQNAGRSASDLLREHGVNSPLASTAANIVFGPGGRPAALREGALSGLTAGLSRVGEAKLAGLALGSRAENAVKQQVRDLETSYPDTYRAGEYGGMATGALVGGAGGAGALFPTAGIGAVGGAVEAGVGRSLAGLAARGALGRAAAAGLELGARGAAEGALFGGVSELSEEMLGDHDLNAEKIIAAAGQQGIYGSLLGVGLGGAGSLAKSGALGLKSLAESTLAENAGTLRGAADEQFWRALSAPKQVAKEAEARFPGGTKGLGQVVRKYDIAGEDWQQAMSSGHPAAMLPKVDEALDSVGKAIGEIHGTSPATVKFGDLYRALDSAISKAEGQAGREGVAKSLAAYRASLAAHLGQAEQLATLRRADMLGSPKQIVVPDAVPAEVSGSPFGPSPQEKLRARALRGVELNAARAAREAAAQGAEMPVADVIRQRKALDDLVYGEAKSLDPNQRVALLREIRSGINKLTVDAIDEAAAKAGNPDVGARLRALSHDYQGLSLIEKGLQSSSAGGASNLSFGIMEGLYGGTGAKLGSEIGGLAAGAIGATGGGLAGGVLGGVGGRLLRQRGNALAGHLLDKLADFAEMQRQIRTVDEQITRSARGLVSASTEKPKLGAGERTPAKPTTPIAQRYARALEASAKLDSEAKDLADRITRDPIPNAPKTSASLSTAALRSAAYLASQRPPSTAQPMLGPMPKPSTDSVTAASYLRTHEAVANPMSALKDFERGQVTPEAVRALQVVSPKMFEQLQREVVTVIGDRLASGKPVPFQTRLKLGILLGVETDPALNPKMLAALQGSISAPPEEPGPKPRATPVNLKSNPTGLDKLEAS
jgi:hypothetical protein